MDYSVEVQSLDWYKKYWIDHNKDFDWDPIFILPPWLQAWKKHFAPSSETSVIVAKNAGKIIGFAPLQIKGSIASIIGNPSVCDYEDLVSSPGKEKQFYSGVFDFLKKQNIKMLETGAVRPDSKIEKELLPFASQSGEEIICKPDEVSLEKELPATWDAYLQTLDSKQRHEVKRKLRRLEEAGKISYRFITEPTAVPEFLEIFLKMFVESREDKAAFLTKQAEGFFRDLASGMAEFGLLRGGILELDKVPVASVFAFDYKDTVYLYNSGFDPNQLSLSVGILSKALLIKDCIERGKKKFDFLKGAERYKYHLGGVEVKLQQCSIKFH